MFYGQILSLLCQEPYSFRMVENLAAVLYEVIGPSA